MALTEGKRAGEFIVSEANGNRSREVVTLTSGEVVVAGQVLGKVTSGGKYVSCDQDAGDGSDTAAGISYGNYDATDGDIDIVIIARDAEVNEDELTFDSANDAGEIVELKADLKSIGIIVRDAI